MGFGVERTCGFTRTFFGPGFRAVRCGRHFVLAMLITSFPGLVTRA